MAEKKYMLTWL